MKRLVLVRGLPGYGKTTFANLLGILGGSAVVTIAAADLMMEDGKYVFRPEKLEFAHLECYSCAKNSMALHVPVVVVHNTFTRERDLREYMELGQEMGYDVVVLTVENRHGSKSIHDVPDKTLEVMKNRFQVKL